MVNECLPCTADKRQTNDWDEIWQTHWPAYLHFMTFFILVTGFVCSCGMFVHIRFAWKNCSMPFNKYINNAHTYSLFTPNFWNAMSFMTYSIKTFHRFLFFTFCELLGNNRAASRCLVHGFGCKESFTLVSWPSTWNI